ncbi:hypothetical protein O5558_20675 [Escherichia coli]|nr:hypothetical protein [Escherichia coli]
MVRYWRTDNARARQVAVPFTATPPASRIDAKTWAKQSNTMQQPALTA